MYFTSLGDGVVDERPVRALKGRLLGRYGREEGGERSAPDVGHLQGCHFRLARAVLHPDVPVHGQPARAEKGHFVQECGIFWLLSTKTFQHS